MISQQLPGQQPQHTKKESHSIYHAWKIMENIVFREKGQLST